MKSWQVIMTDTAKNDLREIALGIFEASGGLEPAVRFVTEPEKNCDSLNLLPEAGALPKDYVLKALGYRYLTHKQYLIFYLTDSAEHKVFIHAVFHEKLDYFRFMSRRI